MGSEAPLLLLAILGSAFLGSWHCAAMCGPIVATLSRHPRAWLYQAGRGVSYGSIGLLAGAFGQLILPSLPLVLRIAIMLILALVLLGTAFPDFFSPLQKKMIPSFRIPCGAFRKSNLFWAGAFSVFLPCGWLWSFVAAAVATHNLWSGFLVMFSLWLGSLPALLFIDLYFRRTLATRGPNAANNSLLPRWAPRILAGAGLYALFAHFVHAL